MEKTEALYEAFKRNLESVNGACFHAAKADVPGVVADIFKEGGVGDVCVEESDFLNGAGLTEGLRARGMEVFTDHIRLKAETAKGGVSEAQYGIADLGTLVQMKDDVDGRIVSTMSEYYVGIVRLSALVEDYDKMFDLISGLPEQPAFVGFMTGPSRTADIECVSTVGVHGPLRLAAVVVDDA